MRLGIDRCLNIISNQSSAFATGVAQQKSLRLTYGSPCVSGPFRSRIPAFDIARPIVLPDNGDPGRRGFPRIATGRGKEPDIGVMAGALARPVPIGLDNVSKPKVRSRPGLAEPKDGEDVPGVPGVPDRAGDRDTETRRTGAQGREPAMQPMIEPLPASAGEATGPEDFRARLPKDAVDRFRAKGCHVGFDHRDTAAVEHKAVEHKAVDAALAGGWTFRRFCRELGPLRRRKGWWGRRMMTDPLTGETRPVQPGSARCLGIILDTSLRMAWPICGRGCAASPSPTPAPGPDTPDGTAPCRAATIPPGRPAIRPAAGTAAAPSGRCPIAIPNASASKPRRRRPKTGAKPGPGTMRGPAGRSRCP